MIIFVFLGIIDSILQLTILREFTFSIAKNELAFVVAAGVWIISCSLGSLLGHKIKLRRVFNPVIISIVFCLSISAIHLAKSLWTLSYYEAASLGFVFLSSIILISPSAFTIGYLFCHFVQKILQDSTSQEKLFAKFFAFEAIGFFLGGFIFTFFLSSYSNPFIFSILPLLLLLTIKKRGKQLISAIAIIVVAIVSLTSFNLILKKELRGSLILRNLGSRYGPIILAEKAQVKSWYANGSLLATSEDKVWNEEFIHMSLSAIEAKSRINVLFIGVCLPGHIEEILKYNVNKLDCININPVLSRISAAGLNRKLKEKTNFIVNDPRLYLKRTNRRYDAILMSMPAPSNIALNRYYSKEFFQTVKAQLSKNGIFAFHIPSKRDILSPQILKFNSIILNSLDKVFRTRFLIPSDSMIIIASSRQKLKTSDLINNFSKAKIKTEFFTIYHFKDYVDAARRAYIEKMLDKKIEQNTDLAPFGFLNYLLVEQIKFYPGLKFDIQKIRGLIISIFSLIVILILILNIIFKRTTVLTNMAAIGFSSISFSAIIFVLFQLYSGALFWKLGLLVGIFMVGLAVGTFVINSIKERAKIQPANISLLFLSWAFLILSLYLAIEKIGSTTYVDFLFYFFSICCGVLTGATYPLITSSLLKNKFERKNVTVFTYALDLCGAFLGTFIVSILFIPFLGIPQSLIMLLGLCALFSIKNLLS